MAVTITDAEDAYLKGKSDFEKWRQDFERSWFEPLRLTLARQALAALTPQQLKELRDMNPQAFDEAVKELGG